MAGSNPNPDHTVGVKFPTEYRVEKFFPSYYDQARPKPQGLPTKLSYGGQPFDISLTSADLRGDMKNLDHTKVVIIRTGFSTHAMVNA